MLHFRTKPFPGQLVEHLGFSQKKWGTWRLDKRLAKQTMQWFSFGDTFKHTSI